MNSRVLTLPNFWDMTPVTMPTDPRRLLVQKTPRFGRGVDNLFKIFKRMPENLRVP